MARIKKTVRRNFSLIEILTVMIIAIAVMTIMIPSARKLVRGNRVDELASSIKLGLEQAQVQALSRRTTVAVIFPSNSSRLSDVQWKKYLLGGYRLVAVALEAEKDEGGNPVLEGGNPVYSWAFRNWLPGSEWHAVPPGVNLVLVTGSKPTIGQGLDGAMGSTTLSYGSPFLKILKVPDEFDSGTQKTQYGVIFDRYGQPYNLANPIYLCVAETEIDGSAISFPNQAGESAPLNYQVLELKNFSGKVSYVQE